MAREETSAEEVQWLQWRGRYERDGYMTVGDGPEFWVGRPPISRSQAKTRRGFTKALVDIETFLMTNGVSEFVYDEELDVFRFAEDGRFAFCEEFADWDLLEERGYLDRGTLPAPSP